MIPLYLPKWASLSGRSSIQGGASSESKLLNGEDGTWPLSADSVYGTKLDTVIRKVVLEAYLLLTHEHMGTVPWVWKRPLQCSLSTLVPGWHVWFVFGWVKLH